MFRETVPTRFVAANDKLSIFIGKVYGTAPKVSTTLWIFHKAPIVRGETRFNTAAAVAEIDCAARTMKRTTVTQLHGEIYGADQASRVISREAVSEAPTTYAPNTIFGMAIEMACAKAAPDEKKNPSFQTLSQARTFGLVVSRQ